MYVLPLYLGTDHLGLNVIILVEAALPSTPFNIPLHWMIEDRVTGEIDKHNSTITTFSWI